MNFIDRMTKKLQKPFVVRSTQKRFVVFMQRTAKHTKKLPTKKPFVVRSTQKRFLYLCGMKEMLEILRTL